MLQDKIIDKSVPIPLYYQLESLLLEEIKDGTYKPGDLIPTEVELSEMFQISRTTVRQAISELVNEGYVYRVKSKGTFVSQPKIERQIPAGTQSYNSFSFEQDVYEKGLTPETKVLELRAADIPSAMRKAGYSSASGKAVYMYRVRYADSEPLERVITYLNYDYFHDLIDTDIVEKYTMGEIMNRSEATKVKRLDRTLEVLPASSEDVRYLNVKARSPIQLLTTVRYNASGEVMDISYAYYRGDRSRLHFEITLD